MATKSFGHDHAEHAKSRFHLSDNVRGVLIVVVGSVALVGAAYGAMVALTGPDGWATRMANTASAGETTLTSFDTPSPQ